MRTNSQQQSGFAEGIRKLADRLSDMNEYILQENNNWKNLTLFQLLQRAASNYANKDGLVTLRERYTYDQLLGKTLRIAQALLDAGVDPSDRVATLFDTRSEWVVLNLAISCLGGIAIPLNLRLQPQELRHELQTARVNVLITLDYYREHDLLERIERACPDIVQIKNGRVRSRILPNLRFVFCFSPENKPIRTYANYRDIIRSGSSVKHENLQRNACSIDPSTTSLIMFTSGSTGVSKGVMLSNRSLIGQAFHLSQLLKMIPADRYLLLLPFFHIAGYVQGLVLNLFAGSSLHLLDSFHAQEAVERIERDHISVLAAMPVTTQRILDYASTKQIHMGSLKKVHAVDAIFCERYKRQSNARLFTAAYGLTESALVVSAGVLEEKHQKTRTEYVGKPFPGISIRIVDPETHEEKPTGCIGEITFKGWNLFHDYAGEVLHKETFFDNQGYFLTGDMGYLDAGGSLYFSGRYKEIVKTGGENVSQLEVENFIKENVPGVKSVFVIGVPDQVWGEVVTAIIEPIEDYELSADLVRSHCIGKIASFKIPKHILPMPPEGWPLKDTMKVDKPILRQWAIEQLGIV